MTDGRAIDPALLLENTDWVRALALRLVRDPHLADDLAQDTWLAAMTARIRPRSDLRGWLAGILRNLVSRQGRRREPASAGLLVDASGTGACAEELLAEAELQRRVIEAVTVLPEVYRTTVLLRHFEGLTVEELSRRLGVPSSTGRTRLQRAHEQLRQRLDRAYGRRSEWAAFVGTSPGGIGVSGGGSAVLATLCEVGIMGTKARLAALLVVSVGLGLVARRFIEREAATDAQRSARVSAALAPQPAPSETSAANSAVPFALDRERVPAAPTPARAAMEGASPEGTGERTAFEAIEPLAAALDEIAESFLTSEPRIEELLRHVEALARAATVDPESVVVNPENGTVTGTCRVGLELEGGFIIEPGGVDRIEFVTEAKAPFLQRTLTVSFLDHVERGLEGWCSVVFLPDTRQPTQKVAESGYHFLGWGVETNREAGTIARPTALPPVNSARMIEGSKSAEPLPIAFPWLGQVGAYDAWVGVLRPFAGR